MEENDIEKIFLRNFEKSATFGGTKTQVIDVRMFRKFITEKLAKKLLSGLTKREAQVLALRVAFDLDYDEIGEKLRITPERAKAYKYHGMKKAKERAEKYDRD